MVAVLVEMGKLSLSLRSLVREEVVPPAETEANAIQQVDLKEPRDPSDPQTVKLKPELPAGKTFTLDTEVSGLMSVRRVTIMRGGASEDVRVSK
jgi:hypothetical protein